MEALGIMGFIFGLAALSQVLYTKENCRHVKQRR